MFYPEKMSPFKLVFGVTMAAVLLRMCFTMFWEGNQAMHLVAGGRSTIKNMLKGLNIALGESNHTNLNTSEDIMHTTEFYNTTLMNEIRTEGDEEIDPEYDRKHKNSEFTETDVTGTRNADQRYLVPVHFDGNGPNVQYNSFGAGVAYALYYKRSVVEPIFFTHWEQKGGGRQTRYMNETFDLEKLKKIVEFVTLKQFNLDCNNSIEMMLVDPMEYGERILESSYRTKADAYRQIYGIHFPEFEMIPNTPTGRTHAIQNSHSVKCLGIYEPSFWKTKFADRSELDKTVSKYLVRAPYVRKIARTISQKLCHGKPFLSFHWRNKTCEKLGRLNQMTPKVDVEIVAAVDETAKVAANDIRVFMTAHNLSCIYVALPSFAKSMITILKEANVSNVVGKTDIIPPKYPDVENLKNDAYVWSLIEQEICIQSDIFLSALHSSWSVQVRNGRREINEYDVTLANIITWQADGVTLK
ncbi:uncharacterized protein LOC144450969 [Glandiceps talaboti]